MHSPHVDTPRPSLPTPPSIAAARTSFPLRILSMAMEEWSGDVLEVSLPGLDGRFGVMARHLPVLALLREGMVHIHPQQGEPLQYYVSGGYVEVQPDAVIVMADTAARSDDLDTARAEAARECALSPMACHLTDTEALQVHLDLLQRYSVGLRGIGRR